MEGEDMIHSILDFMPDTAIAEFLRSRGVTPTASSRERRTNAAVILREQLLPNDIPVESVTSASVISPDDELIDFLEGRSQRDLAPVSQVTGAVTITVSHPTVVTTTAGGPSANLNSVDCYAGHQSSAAPAYSNVVPDVDARNIPMPPSARAAVRNAEQQTSLSAEATEFMPRATPIVLPPEILKFMEQQAEGLELLRREVEELRFVHADSRLANYAESERSFRDHSELRNVEASSRHDITQIPLVSLSPSATQTAITPVVNGREVRPRPPVNPTASQHRRHSELLRVTLKNLQDWGLKFEGTGKISAEEFLTRLAECRRGTGLLDEEMLVLLPRLFAGIARQWYRVNEAKFTSFDVFCAAFRDRYGDPEHSVRVQMQALTRTQGADEPVGDFLVCVQRLWQCQGEDVPIEMRLAAAYHNMKPEFRASIRRSDFESFDELTKLATTLERCVLLSKKRDTASVAMPELSYSTRSKADLSAVTFKETPVVKPSEKPAATNSQKPSYAAVSKNSGRNKPVSSKTNVTSLPRKSGSKKTEMPCWNCGERGHFYSECRATRVGAFCFKCGQKDTITTNCPRCSGNGQGMGKRAFAAPPPRNPERQ